jgi:hypothetical protein
MRDELGIDLNYSEIATPKDHQISTQMLPAETTSVTPASYKQSPLAAAYLPNIYSIKNKPHLPRQESPEDYPLNI